MILSRFLYFKKDGFTLIEVLVSISILTLIIVPIMGYFSNLAKVTGESKNRSEAINLGRWTMDNVKGAANLVSRLSKVDVEDEDGNEIDIDFNKDYLISELKTTLQNIIGPISNPVNYQLTFIHPDHPDYQIEVKLEDYGNPSDEIKKVIVKVKNLFENKVDTELQTLITNR